MKKLSLTILIVFCLSFAIRGEETPKTAQVQIIINMTVGIGSDLADEVLIEAKGGQLVTVPFDEYFFVRTAVGRMMYIIASYGETTVRNLTGPIELVYFALDEDGALFAYQKVSEDSF